MERKPIGKAGLQATIRHIFNEFLSIDSAGHRMLMGGQKLNCRLISVDLTFVTDIVALSMREKYSVMALSVYLCRGFMLLTNEP
jgi:hypothetical protein